MHFWQAIKMAFKSLKTNKTRSFLTMLGIIIGVMTVSLLTSVAQGVTDTVVSSVRSQSTLAVFMNINKSLKFAEADEILREYQPDASADNYFEYSLIYSKSTKVANLPIENISSEEELASALTEKKQYTLADFPNYDSMSEEEKAFVTLLTQETSHKSYYGTEVMAVDRNFDKVYTLEYDGKYMENSNEIMVDSKFVKTYFGENVTSKEALNRKVTLGIDCFTQIKFIFENEEAFNEKKQAVINVIEKNSYSIGTKAVSFDIIENLDNSKYVINQEENGKISIVVNISTISYFDNSYIKGMIRPELNDTSIGLSVKDLIDYSNAKTYTVVAVISDDTSSLLSSMSTTSSSSSSMDNYSNSVLVTYMTSLSVTNGLCYMFYDDTNATTFGQTDVQSSTVMYAYLRYRNENVMNSSTTGLVVTFSSKGYTYLSDYMLVSFSSVANIISNIMNILTIMLTVISVISLIVGGIGIMNIMLVAVSERTREIGIRKAIGAKKSSILVQFLVEALMLSIVGGMIGLGISAIGMMIISHFMKVTLLIPLWVIGMSVGFCTAIGLIFGMFPAVKASNMQPIEALRRE